MKKVLSILSVFVLCIGMYSCEVDSAEDQALYEKATDGDENQTVRRTRG
ncbi:hypothetical protein [Eudoraea chungangensis]|nr:hypothetical protein [Eudoraea chungangensis]